MNGRSGMVEFEETHFEELADEFIESRKQEYANFVILNPDITNDSQMKEDFIGANRSDFDDYVYEQFSTERAWEQTKSALWRSK